MKTYLEPLVGRVCSRVTIDAYSPVVVLWFLYEGPRAYVQIDAPFTLRTGGLAETLDPYGEREALAPVMRVIGNSVTSATLGDQDALLLEFSDDLGLHVPGDPSEPWWFDILPDEWPEDDQTSGRGAAARPP